VKVLELVPGLRLDGYRNESAVGSLGQALLVRVVDPDCDLLVEEPDVPALLAGRSAATHFPFFSSWFLPQVNGHTRPEDFFN
jgi:hypothetical protein